MIAFSKSVCGAASPQTRKLLQKTRLYFEEVDGVFVKISSLQLYVRAYISQSVCSFNWVFHLGGPFKVEGRHNNGNGL